METLPLEILLQIVDEWRSDSLVVQSHVCIHSDYGTIIDAASAADMQLDLADWTPVTLTLTFTHMPDIKSAKRLRLTCRRMAAAYSNTYMYLRLGGSFGRRQHAYVLRANVRVWASVLYEINVTMMLLEYLRNQDASIAVIAAVRDDPYAWPGFLPLEIDIGVWETEYAILQHAVLFAKPQHVWDGTIAEQVPKWTARLRQSGLIVSQCWRDRRDRQLFSLVR